jgi:antitoxin (DNA-binding transcriptional repressor) of toxin-antitoxin stability system
VPTQILPQYVVPEWARTTTATRPRISAEALGRREAENAREHAKALERKLANHRNSRGRATAERYPACVCSSFVSVNTTAPRVVRQQRRERRNEYSGTTHHGSPCAVIVPCTPTRRLAGASLRRGDPATSLSPAMFSANGSPLFSAEADDDDERITLELVKAAHVLSPIQSVLSGRRIGIGMERPGSPLRCKSSAVRLARVWI